MHACIPMHAYDNAEMQKKKQLLITMSFCYYLFGGGKEVDECECANELKCRDITDSKG